MTDKTWALVNWRSEAKNCRGLTRIRTDSSRLIRESARWPAADVVLSVNQPRAWLFSSFGYLTAPKAAKQLLLCRISTVVNPTLRSRSIWYGSGRGVSSFSM